MFSISKLTSRQEEVLEFLKEFKRSEGSSPTYREIADRFGFKSPKAAVDHVYALEKKGYVRRHSGRSRGIEVLVSSGMGTAEAIHVPVLGNITAGIPEIKFQEDQGRLAIDKSIVEGSMGHRLFALMVNGESMQGRDIHHGDWVVADADVDARLGDIVVALIDGENTLKTLSTERGRFFLKAESPNYSDLIPIEEIVIQGVVKAVLRRITR